MDFSKCNIGLGITGSFCMFSRARKEIERLTELGANVIPIFSFNAQTCDTRFGSAKDYVEGICDITGNEGIRTICAAEPIGPNNFLDIMVIRNNNRHSQFFCHTDLFHSGNSIVAGQNGIHSVFKGLLDNGFIDSIPILNPVRYPVISKSAGFL